MWTGNQHGGREYDDLQNFRDMTSHENPQKSMVKVKQAYTIITKIMKTNQKLTQALTALDILDHTHPQIDVDQSFFRVGKHQQ